MAHHTRSSFESTGSSPLQSSIPSKDLPYRPLVIADPVAACFLEADPSTTVLTRRETLCAFETYVVEQWACTRVHPTCLISTYTGDPSHTITVTVLAAPLDRNDWSPRLKAYFDALQRYHAWPRETPLGTLMSTNPSSFPSSLTLVKVPEGDVKKHWEDFVVNENLKRLGCAGRAGLSLTPPTSATVAKFHQLYRTSEKVPLYQSVIELVRLCQLALVIFGKFSLDYSDGLLCDMTEAALRDWWIEFGSDYFSVEPNDGILGPTTVAALLGLLMGARNRLHVYGAPISKEVFEIECTKRAVAYFQKASGLPKTRRLDRRTLQRLHSATAKAAEQKSSEGWTVPRAVKSTVAELSGKGGEMVMEMVGRGEKAGIADVETVDLDTFIDSLRGESAKWLWHGKGKKSQTSDAAGKYSSTGPTEKSHHHHSRHARPPPELARTETATLQKSSTADEELLASGDVSRQPSIREPDGGIDGDREKKPRRHALQRAGIKVKDTVSGKRHQPKGSKDGKDLALYQENTEESKPSLLPSTSYAGTTTDSPARDRSHSPADPHGVLARMPMFSTGLVDTPTLDSRGLLAAPSVQVSGPDSGNTSEAKVCEVPPIRELGAPIQLQSEPMVKERTNESFVSGSTYRGVDLDELFGTDPENEIGPSLRPTYSMSELSQLQRLRDAQKRHERDEPVDQDDGECRNARWARHLSFSVAESTILTWTKPWADEPPRRPSVELPAEYQDLLYEACTLRRLRARLRELSCLHARDVLPQLRRLSTALDTAGADQAAAEATYMPFAEAYAQAREEVLELVEGERGRLLEAVKDVELLGSRLDYEVHALRNKVEDVEEALGEFEGTVRELEEKIEGIEREDRRPEGWRQWVLRWLLFGVAKLEAEGPVESPVLEEGEPVWDMTVREG